MDENTRTQLTVYALSILTVLIPLVWNYMANYKKNAGETHKLRSDSDAVDVETFQKLVDKVAKLSDDVILLKSNNSALWSYVYDLIEFIIEKGHVPPPPPAELDTNPKLIKLLGHYGKKTQ